MNLLTQNRNFRLLFSARLITNIGDSVYFIAAMWLVYQLSGSSFFSGLAGF
ncbi:MFS general substrate transporter [Sporolactobacillus inulinus]|nr:MFS general substrate transporter [Sporolactobacillus inulinus]